MRSAAGEIVEVQGGHILRSVGRKDRHSKVCTAKGPRDRRVRLAANTAIQFYDVQDRLGFDRPSKAVDWLIQNARAAIDELLELPAWRPSSAADNSGEKPEPDPSVDFSFHGSSGGDRAGSCIQPPSIDSNTIAEMAADRSAYFSPDFFSNRTHQPQNLRLSLQSIQDTAFNHSNPMQYHPLYFDSAPASFAEQNQRIASWNLEACGGGYSAADFSFNMAPVLFCQGHLSTQREPLQSSIDQQIHQPLTPAISSAGSALGGRGFSGFHIPAPIQGEEVLEGISDKPSSASSASYHR